MSRRSIIKKLLQEVKGAIMLQITVNGNSVTVSKESATTPVRFRVLTTVLAILYALPYKFFKNAETLVINVKPRSFSIHGETSTYAFTLVSLPKDSRVEKAEIVIPEDFIYFCKVHGLTEGANEALKINFQFK